MNIAVSETKLLQVTESLRDQQIALLREFIAIPSAAGLVWEVQQRIAAVMERAGAQVESFEAVLGQLRTRRQFAARMVAQWRANEESYPPTERELRQPPFSSHNCKA